LSKAFKIIRHQKTSAIQKNHKKLFLHAEYSFCKSFLPATNA